MILEYGWKAGRFVMTVTDDDGRHWEQVSLSPKEAASVRVRMLDPTDTRTTKIRDHEQPLTIPGG